MWSAAIWIRNAWCSCPLWWATGIAVWRTTIALMYCVVVCVCDYAATKVTILSAQSGPISFPFSVLSMIAALPMGDYPRKWKAPWRLGCNYLWLENNLPDMRQRGQGVKERKERKKPRDGIQLLWQLLYAAPCSCSCWVFCAWLFWELHTPLSIDSSDNSYSPATLARGAGAESTAGSSIR